MTIPAGKRGPQRPRRERMAEAERQMREASRGKVQGRQRDKCYLIPVGGDSLDFLRVHAPKRPDKKTQDALRDLFQAAYKHLSDEQREEGAKCQKR